MGRAELFRFVSDDALAASAAEAWINSVARASVEGRRLLVALSGGRVTKKFFASTVAVAGRQGVSFQPVEFFWADERCVPPDNPESNFRLAKELLFQPGKVADASVHRIEGELDPGTAAQRATEALRAVAGQSLSGMPVLDLVLLGMGEDGHVASLFPDDTAIRQDTSVFLAVENSPKPPPQRVTLGFAPILAAREVWVLVSGRGKQVALRESLSTGGRTPLARVIRGRELTKIYSDVESV